MVTVVVRLAVLGDDQLVPGDDVDGLAGGGLLALPQVLSQVQLAGGEGGGGEGMGDRLLPTIMKTNTI